MVIILVHKLVIVLVPNIVIILVLAFSQHIDFIILFHFSELLIVGPIPPFLRSELLILEVSVILLKSTVNMVIVTTNQQVKTYLCLAMVTSVSLKKNSGSNSDSLTESEVTFVFVFFVFLIIL